MSDIRGSPAEDGPPDRTRAGQGKLDEQPQRDSNPCLYLERVAEHREQRTLWDSDGQ
jgi:hypothetical protein